MLIFQIFVHFLYAQIFFSSALLLKPCETSVRENQNLIGEKCLCDPADGSKEILVLADVDADTDTDADADADTDADADADVDARAAMF